MLSYKFALHNMLVNTQSTKKEWVGEGTYPEIDSTLLLNIVGNLVIFDSVILYAIQK